MESKVVTREEWLEARAELLAQEAALGEARRAVTAARRALPMVEVAEEYVFHGPDGAVKLADLFEGRRQLLVYHFMFGPDWAEGCKHCSLIIDSIGRLEHMHALDTTMVLASRAPYEKIAAFKERMGWTVPWYSVDGPSFNFDFHASLEDAFDPKPDTPADAEVDRTRFLEGEVGAFIQEDGRVYHTYSTYGEGTEIDLLHNTFNLLDLSHLGRQDDVPGRPWLYHHDKYPVATSVGA